MIRVKQIFFLTLAMTALSVRGESVGLVLSGGGAKGIAHIGVIQALEDNNIPIDYITGTSMGAIVGGLYAAGYSPSEMVQLIASPGFYDWSTGRINPELTTYYLEPKRTAANININLGFNRQSQLTSILPMSVINPIPMNLAFLELFTPYTAQCQGDFNRLFVPFRCVTSDIYEKHKVVLSQGSLGDAVRMSMSFPVIFHPIDRDGIPMYDGGIYDNYPVDVMVEDFDPDRIIGINVSTPSPPKTRNMLDQVEEMIMQPDTFPFPDDKGINIHIDLEQFSLLDFGACEQIYKIGYQKAMENMDSIRRMISARTSVTARTQRRADFKAATPEVKIDSVTVAGMSGGENRYVRSIFPRKPFGLGELRKGYYQAISPHTLQNLVPYPVYNPEDSAFTINFQGVAKEKFDVGLGMYLSTSTSSMLYLSGGYHSISGRAVDASLNLMIGQSYLGASLAGRVLLPSATLMAIEGQVNLSQKKFTESQKLFFQTDAPDFVTKSDVDVQLGWSIATGRHGKFMAGAGYGHLTDKFVENQRDNKGHYDLGKLFVDYEMSTLDDPFQPMMGYHLHATADGVLGKYHPLGQAEDVKWLQLNFEGLKFFPLSHHVSLGASLTTQLSTRKLLPSYMASIVAATQFMPTASCHDNFNMAFRANSYVTAGMKPVFKFGSGTFSIRNDFHLFLPVRPIRNCGGIAEYGAWISHPEFFGQIAPTFSMPWINVQAYANYFSAGTRNWNFGMTIGFLMTAPKFL